MSTKTYTKTYTKKGFDFRAEITGEAQGRVADVWSCGEYIGKLYCVACYRGDNYRYWSHKQFSFSSLGLFEAAMELASQHYLAQEAAQ